MASPDILYEIRTAHVTGNVSRVMNLVSPSMERRDSVRVGRSLEYQMDEAYVARNLAPTVIFPGGTYIEACPVPDQPASLLAGPFAVGINSAWEYVFPRTISLYKGDDQSFYGKYNEKIEVPFNTTTAYCTSNGLTQTVEIEKGGLFNSENPNLSAIVYGTILFKETFLGNERPSDAQFVGPFMEVDDYFTKLGLYEPSEQKSFLDPILDRVAHYAQMPFKGILKAATREELRSGLVFNSQVRQTLVR